MNREEAKRQAELHSPDFLRRAKNIGNKPSYVCPCCSNGTGQSKTGITRIPGSNNHPKYHCFKCGFTGDVFDLAKEYTGLSSQASIFNYVYQAFGITIDGTKEFANVDVIPNIVPNKEEPEEDVFEYVNQVEYFKKCALNLNPKYLEGRGISFETQKHFMVGTDLEWINPRMVDMFKEKGWNLSSIPKSPRCIIPTDSYSYLARDIRENLSEREEKYAKLKYGKTPIFNEKRSQKEEIVFVTEGEIDAMSVYEVSKMEPAALGSTSNWRHLVVKANEGGPYNGKAFILLLDNDEPGKKTQELLADSLSALGNIVVQPSLGIYKDPNKYLTNDREGFKNLVLDSLQKVKEAQIQKQSHLETEMEM